MFDPEKIPDDVDEFVEEIESALADLDGLPDCDEAQEFSDGVRETLEGIRETVLRRLVVTGNQRKAIENICSGICGWNDR